EADEYGSLSLEVWESKENMISTFLQVSKSTEPKLLDVEEGLSQEHPSKRAKYQEGLLSKPRQRVLVCPLRLFDESMAFKFFVMAVNPQRPLDEGYLEFTKSLCVILMASLKSIILAQEAEIE